MANGPQVESFLGAIKNEKLGLTLLVRMNPDVRRQFARRVSESSSGSLSTACGRKAVRVKIAACLSEQSAAGFVESQFCCVEQRMNDQERRLHAEQRSRRQGQVSGRRLVALGLKQVKLK